MKVKTVWEHIYDDNPDMAKEMEEKSQLFLLLQQAIETHGWSKKQIALELGITQSQAFAILNGKLSKFTIKNLVELNHKLGNKIQTYEDLENEEKQ
ncbi:MAG: XRE family transcriptional regulator [Micrococcaceae bacterium]